MINLVITDNHPIMIDGIKTTLKDETNIQIVAVASNGVELLNVLKKITPDIILMDVSLEGMTGLDVAKIILEKHKKIKILFLSQFDDKWLIKKCIEVGGKGYLIKNISKKDLIEAIYLVDKGILNFFYKHGIYNSS